MQNLNKELSQTACPKCNAVGGLYISISSYTVSCRNCKNTFIDPFEVGPWDSHITVMELLDDEQIIRRIPNEVEETVDDKNKMEFFKFLYEKKGGKLS